MAEYQSTDVAIINVPMDFNYNIRVGPYIEKFIKGLGEKKLLGVKCGKCGKVAVPPKKVCGACSAIMNEWVEVGPEGVVENFTIGHVKLNKGIVEPAEPYVVALVKLDGATSLFPAVIAGVEPGAVRKGMRVRAVFKDPPEDALTDLEHFEPAA